jgi:hypothetical protein
MKTSQKPIVCEAGGIKQEEKSVFFAIVDVIVSWIKG